MNKKMLAAAAVVFALCFVMDYVLHGVILRDLYGAVPYLWRTEAEVRGLTWIIWAVNAVMSCLFVWLYSKGKEAQKPWLGQGLRFGFAVGLLFSLPMGFSMYAIMPVPLALGFGWFAGALAEFLVLGVTVSWMLRS